MTFKVRGTDGNVYSRALAHDHAAAQRIELRAPEPSANACLTFTTQPMEGIVDMLGRIAPSELVDKGLKELEPEVLKDIPRVPHSRRASLTFGAWRHLLPKPTRLGCCSTAPQLDIWNESINLRTTICGTGKGFNASAGTAYYWCSTHAAREKPCFTPRTVIGRHYASPLAPNC